jgi:hypothetical protein
MDRAILFQTAGRKPCAAEKKPKKMQRIDDPVPNWPLWDRLWL